MTRVPYVDASIRDEDKPHSQAILIVCDDKGELLERRGIRGLRSASQAEYRAILKAVDLIGSEEQGLIISDSAKAVVGARKRLFHKGITHICITWVPRQHNLAGRVLQFHGGDLFSAKKSKRRRGN